MPALAPTRAAVRFSFRDTQALRCAARAVGVSLVGARSRTGLANAFARRIAVAIVYVTHPDDTQAQIAARVGCHASTVSDELGRHFVALKLDTDYAAAYERALSTYLP